MTVKPSLLAAALVVALFTPSAPSGADTTNVAFPADYQTEFLRYATKDKPKAGKDKTRFFYINKDAFTAAKPGKPLPDGTVLIMEDHKIRLGTDKQPVLDAQGAMIATDAITNIFVMEKRKGWGAGYPEGKRNGEWEYAWFDGTGKRRTDKKLDRCFVCHKPQASQDYTFITLEVLKALKKN